MSRLAGIEIRGLSKDFRGGTRALDAIDLDLAAGELLVLVGPSGSGKTTLLRLIAGLDKSTAGTIAVDGSTLADVPPHQRNVAMVFQTLALYSHLTVRSNLDFGRKGDGQTEKTAVALGISHLLDRYPAELSGGEQQRVALGRAIVKRPAALLLDEPLSSLDAPLRRDLRRELKKLQRELGMPTIYVTHDQTEALALGDRIAVLDKGQLQQTGTPDEIYHRPANRFVAEFFGPQGMNWIEGELKRDGDSQRFIASSIGIDWLLNGVACSQVGAVLCGFRPEDADSQSPTRLPGKVAAIESLGSVAYAQLELVNQNGRSNKQPLIVRLDPYLELPKINDPLTIGINPSRLHWFDPTTGNRLQS
jgi:ABC-type sugar transport system ATPase subunit